MGKSWVNNIIWKQNWINLSSWRCYPMVPCYKSYNVQNIVLTIPVTRVSYGRWGQAQHSQCTAAMLLSSLVWSIPAVTAMGQAVSCKKSFNYPASHGAGWDEGVSSWLQENGKVSELFHRRTSAVLIFKILVRLCCVECFGAHLWPDSG